MEKRRKIQPYLLTFLPFLLLAVGLAIYLLGDANFPALAPGSGESGGSPDGSAAPPPGTNATDETESNAADRPWDRVETVGEEGELVEVVNEEGWKIVGERVLGVRFNGALPFQVPARKVEDIPMYPCSECHKGNKVNNEKRRLKTKHADLKLDHGDGRFWCEGCHDGKRMDDLFTINGKAVDMDLGYLLCGQCHFREMEDWQHGVHGKRIGFWTGVRVFRTCTECHNAHSPGIKPYTPDPPPVAPKGKTPSSLHTHHRTKLLQRLTAGGEKP